MNKFNVRTQDLIGAKLLQALVTLVSLFIVVHNFNVLTKLGFLSELS